jgi:hypothetical protein
LQAAVFSCAFDLGAAGLTSDPLKGLKSVVDGATQAVSSAAVQAADKSVVSQIKAADQVVHNATVQLASALPENDSELSLPGTQVETLTLLHCGPRMLSPRHKATHIHSMLHEAL